MGHPAGRGGPATVEEDHCGGAVGEGLGPCFLPEGEGGESRYSGDWTDVMMMMMLMMMRRRMMLLLGYYDYDTSVLYTVYLLNRCSPEAPTSKLESRFVCLVHRQHVSIEHELQKAGLHVARTDCSTIHNGKDVAHRTHPGDKEEEVSGPLILLSSYPLMCAAVLVMCYLIAIIVVCVLCGMVMRKLITYRYVPPPTAQ
jgi:hypothetical protein